MRLTRHFTCWIFTLLTLCDHIRMALGQQIQQRQHFRQRPEDQHVVQGTMAVIKCEVGSQVGRVQWAKDGFVLGFNRTIPGYSRYEMVGEGVRGEHHLRIHNTSLEDDADYQCQVGPADGHPAIRATGHLTVLMAPTSVELHGRGRQRTIEVTEGEDLTLECRVRDSKPVAQVKWFKNNKELHIVTRNDTTEESSQRRRHNMISKIDLRLTADDDGAQYSCVVNHPALDSPMRAAVNISVLYPPGPPVITGYVEGDPIRAGEERTLTCRSRGGNPLGRVVWYRNDENVDDTDRHDGDRSINDYDFIVESTDNNAVYTCEVRNKLTTKPLLASVKLDVMFPPDKIRVTGPNTARVGDNVTLMCLVENSNPPAEISWVVDGQSRPAQSTDRKKTPLGGYDSVSKLSVAVPAVDRNMMFTCHSTNHALGETRVDTYELSVLRPPRPPVIHGYRDGMGIRVGNQQKITCVSRGGNPPAHLQWYRNGQTIASQKHRVDDVSSAEIEIVAEAKDNGAQYRCEAHNNAASSPVSVSTTLVVYFPPETVTIMQSPRRLKVGEQASLTCQSSPSNPPAVMTWLRDGYEVHGRRQESMPSVNGGTRVTNTLTLNLTEEDDGRSYTCQAINEALRKEVTQSITLSVNYAPKFLEVPPEIVDLKVGESDVLNLTARANPGPVLYTWTRHGARLSNPVIDDSYRHAYAHDPDLESPFIAGGTNVEPNGPLLYLRAVTIHDAGEYELEASNQEGSSIAKVYINVQYAPAIKYTSEVVTVAEGQDARLICAADGNPLTESMIEWTRDDYYFSRSQQSFAGKKATLMVRRASRNDTGVFTCNINNGIGRTVSANVTLIVKTKPYIRQSQLSNRAASDPGRTGRLHCIADGAPQVSFSWKRDGVLLSNGRRPDKYDNETMMVGLVTWASTFYIKNVDDVDYGTYECIAENVLGASTSTVRFTRPTAPDPPISLKVLNTTHDSAHVEWQPGYDGGRPQYFRLRYRAKDSSSYQYQDIYETGVYQSIVSGLRLDTEYFFSIMSYNEIGDSEYRGEFVRASTSSVAPPTPVPSSNVGKETSRMPNVWVVIIPLVATALLALNVSAIVCIIKHRRSKRASGSGKKTLPKSSSASSTLPKTKPLSTVFEGSDQASSKSTTNTMYTPSSYNDTMAGETLSSISEKSRESYNQEDSVGEYEEQTHKHAASTYLIDQIEPPPEYASQTPSQPSSTAYDPHEDDYAEVLRRNAYNHQLGKGTPRPPSRATHYSTSPETQGYLSFSYTPSPTTVPNGAVQYHSRGPTVTLGIHDHPQIYAGDMGHMGPMSLESIEHVRAMQSLGLDTEPPPSLGLEQHSIPSEHPSLTLDPHSITIDHSEVAVTNFSNRNGDLRVQQPPPPANTNTSNATALSTFSPNPSPSTYSEPDLEGHLV